jgi:uncharacterized phage-associated protein
MSTKYRFDAEKAIEVILYITHRVPDTYAALKVLYFADKDHLAKYGRLICGDGYVAMRHGPVPSGAYDLVKAARGGEWCWPGIEVNEAFSVTDRNRIIVPHREADLDLLSETDVECLDEAIERYGGLSFERLKELSHDEAYQTADQNDFISLEAIVSTLPDSEELLEYLQTN